MYGFDMQCQSTIDPEEVQLFYDNPVADSSGAPEMIPLPEEMLSRLSDKYREVYKLIVGTNSI